MEHLTTRIWAAALSVLLLFVPAGALWALGLGNIEVGSTLNEPLRARIDLSALQSGDLDSMQVQLADAEQFRRAGIERPFQLSRLQFTTVAEGPDAGHISITTRDPVVEPFLNFLVEVTWPRGRIVREYTVLLDPPVYGAAISTQAKRELAEIQARALEQPAVPETPAAPPPEPAAPQPTAPPPVQVQPSTTTAPSPPPTAIEPEPRPEPSMAAAPAAAPEPMPAPPPEPAVQPESSMAPAPAAMPAGPLPDAHDVVWGDTLWSLASRYRPDDSVSIQRMMLAMLSANPDAFNIPNINALRAGTLLQIPDVSQFGSTDRQIILAEVERQNGLWQEYRQGLAASAGAAPEAASASAAESTGSAGQPSQASTAGAGGSSAGGESAEAADSGSAADGATGSATEDGGRLALVSGGQGTEGVGSATSESAGDAATAEQLAIAQEEADARAREAEELSSRVTELEGIVEQLERAIELRDDNIAELQQTLRDLEREADELRAAADQARAEAAASGAVAEQAEQAVPVAPMEPAEPTSETAAQPPQTAETAEQAAEPPAQQSVLETPPETVSEAAPESMQEAPAETPVPAAEETVEPLTGAPSEPAAETAAAVEAAPESAPEAVAATEAEQAAPPAEKKPKKKRKKPVVAAPPQPSFLDTVLESLPVDPVLLGAGVGGLLVVLGGAALWRRRRGGEEAEDMGELDLGDLDESDLLYDDSGEPYLPDDVGEETAISELEGMDLSDEEAEPQVQARAAEEDPLEATHVAPPGAAGAADSEDDPLTEVNVYLAYERYDQAEELVRSAIAQYPDRHEYKLRLLEVFYAAKDIGAFESSARELQDAVGDDSALMGEARKMWQDMSPGRELFSEAESTVPEDQDVLFDVTGPDTETPATVPGGGDESSSVDFDLGFDTDGTQAEAASGESSLDFDLGFDQGAGAEQPPRDESGLDLDLTSIGEAADSGAQAGGGSGLDFDLGDDQAAAGGASGSASMDFDLSGIDESMGGAQGPSTETPLPERVSRDGDDLDFDLEGLGEGTLIDSQVPPQAPAGAFADEPPVTAGGDDGALDFDLEGIGGDSDDAGSGGLSGDAEFTALDLDLDAAQDGGGSRASGLDFDGGDDLTAVDEASSALGFDVGGDSLDANAGASPDDALDFGLDLGDDDGGLDIAGGADFTDETVKLDLDAALPGDDDEQDTVKLSSPEFEAADSAISDLGMDLDLDMGEADGGESSTGVDTAFEGIFGDDDLQGDAQGEDDMALSLDGSDLIPPTPPPEPEAPAEEFPEIDLDFDSEKSQDAAASDEYESTQFMLRDMPASDSDSAKSGASSEGHTLMLGGGLTGEVDEVQTKLDLAQAYIDMGDTDGAKGIIDEVLAEGNSSQKNAAMGLLSKLASS